MNALPPEAPRLPVLPFIATDVVLVGAAALIGWQADAPLGVGSLAFISGLVGLGAIAGLYPFVVNHARRQEEALQERANQIEALARTVGASAEQISIAVSNLPAIAENSARQLKAAEQLPADLQARLATLQQQLSATASEENAALRHELDTLRGAETAKLAAALDGLTRATSDLARLETLAAKHSTALDAAIAHLPRLADSFGKQASDALKRETAAAVSALHAAAAESGAALAAATNEARAAFDRGVRDAVSHLASQVVSTPPFPAHVYRPVIASEPEVEAATPAATEPVATEPVVAEPAQIDAATEPQPEPAATPSVAAETAPPVAAPAQIDDADFDEPADAIPEPARPIISVAEAADETAQTVPAAAPSHAPAKTEQAEADESEPETETAPVATQLDLDADSDAEPEPSAAPAESALSHDGYTRLVATAYIGIGNKLFVRGDGPGLRRDKGVALQFVSIGKWRWESAELLFPAKVRLYKNDQLECSALGEIVLEPGHHHEVAANF